MKRLLCIVVSTVLISSLCGCRSKVNIMTPTERVDSASEERILIKDDNYSGTINFEVKDTYVITDLSANNIDQDKIDPYTFVSKCKENAEDLVNYPDFMTAELSLQEGCKMYIVKMQVTNVDAESGYQKKFGYDSPYVFRADNIYLNCIPESKQTVISKTINYYSLRKEEDAAWCTFELNPGETIQYEIGYIVGPVMFEKANHYDTVPESMYLSSGSDEYYAVKWKEQ